MGRDVQDPKPVDGWRDYETWAVEISKSYHAHDIVDRDDLAQVARLAVWQAWRRWDPSKGPFRVYGRRRVIGAILHEYRDTANVPAWRWERGDRFLPDTLNEELDMPAVEDPGYAAVEWRELLARLPERQAAALWLVAWMGYQQTEAAETLGAHPQQVARWQQYGARYLREALK